MNVAPQVKPNKNAMKLTPELVICDNLQTRRVAFLSGVWLVKYIARTVLNIVLSQRILIHCHGNVYLEAA